MTHPTSGAPAPSRPQRPSQARERILSTADRLFYNEGIHAVGIHRVVEEAAVTRVTLYRHFPSKDDLISAYLERRAQYDRDQVGGLIARHPDDPRRVLTELATALTADDFAAMSRGCPFINASAEFTGSHPARLHAREIRRWVTAELEGLLLRLGHRSPAATADQLMMLRTGAVVSGALDGNEGLDDHFLAGWEKLIDDGLPGRSPATG
ncbi:Transcriptional regulator, TetR family [Modestobacter italicus]|uniref:Transcriptional regulator, TetR family n=1 Tax=Modestobacter italicus (strain DSM 44449 / CECT 9708 / BC 501) TaxID=2732864 RepID=I4ETF0_MODI5|nr:TetR/AcrR family transcriptional regulator [Modestobacter marinus]CCH86663.1 Transcriptional regulator, TetR family [Modestobacter marinus]